MLNEKEKMMKDYFMGMIAGILFGTLLIAIVRHFL